jgi:thimet oligopeptidase
MKKITLSVVLLCGLATLLWCKSEREHTMPRDPLGHIHLKTLDDVYAVYPKTVQEIKDRFEEAKKQANVIVAEIIAVPADKQNKENVLYAFDRLTSYAEEHQGAGLIDTLELVRSVYTDPAVVKAAQETEVATRQFMFKHVSANVELYKALQTYAQGNAKKDNLTQEEQYFLGETLAYCKLMGLDLSEEQRKKVIELTGKEQELSVAYQNNIAQDTSTITATKEQLDGVDLEFIESLKKNEQGEYVLHMDYPTASMIGSYCKAHDTRRRFSRAFSNRAYPENIQVLNELIEVRDQLAKALGFSSFDEMNLFDQMVGSPARVHKFYGTMKDRLLVKADEEFKEFVKDLPEGVTLTADGKIKKGDGGYISTYFKKKYYNVDERKIAEYFPMEKTVKGLLDIYEKFFSIKIEEVKNPKAWHPEVRLLKVTDNNDAVRGYIFLDMFPRPKKYNHAACFPCIKSITKEDGTIYPALSTVVCNFTKSTPTKPSLLKFREVQTFFHEFGHAIHGMLSKPRLVTHSGTMVKTDFVELPSQLLENWMEDKEVLKNLSSHYQTGELMPNDLLDGKLKELKFGLGMGYAGQMFLGNVALEFFGSEKNKDPHAISKRLGEEYSPHSEYDPDGHFECNFGHLAQYKARYYGYLWSRVFADDVFEKIEEEGLLNPKAGKRYLDEILGRGGSKDPNQMLRDYLGREPNADAFLKRIGL